MVSVIVSNGNVSSVYVQSYPSDTDEPDVKKDQTKNALYFSITNYNIINDRRRYEKINISTPLFLFSFVFQLSSYF